MQPSTFYLNPTLAVARNLLGRELLTSLDGVTTGGYIVETEAYMSQGDAASHARMGPNDRNKPMFLPAGHLYVYRSYGIHFCLNIVTEDSETGCAVLIRAIEPTKGINEMRMRRNTTVVRDIARGPGRLCQALGIDLAFNGLSLMTSSTITIDTGIKIPAVRIHSSSRIGITKAVELPWRFYVEGSQFVSGPNSKGLKIRKSVKI